MTASVTTIVTASYDRGRRYSDARYYPPPRGYVVRADCRRTIES